MAVVEEAGAIVVRSEGSDTQVLLVTGSTNDDHWIFPKGHIERGESLETAALREALEEAGVDGAVLGPAGSLTFTRGNHTYRVHYFVVTTHGRGRPSEGRSLAWCSYEEALNQLTFEDNRALLREIWPRIASGST